jgi:hypothetical protein
MRDRQTSLLWMKDLIEHMKQCHDQLEWASDARTEAFLTDAMVADLNECRRLCDQFGARSGRGDGLKASGNSRQTLVSAKG